MLGFLFHDFKADVQECFTPVYFKTYMLNKGLFTEKMFTLSRKKRDLA